MLSPSSSALLTRIFGEWSILRSCAVIKDEKNAQATAPHYSHRSHSWNGITTGVAYTYFRLFPRIHAFLCKTQQPEPPQRAGPIREAA